MDQPLKKYRAKRNFAVTEEPEGLAPGPDSTPLRFVVQMHDARKLHWDLRLECDGLLKSWAVPKGPSLDPTVKRLAVHVEDHPLEYADFEGTIPHGQYGGGEVIVWDEGVYGPDEEGLVLHDRKEAQRQIREGLVQGKLSFTLFGQKLRGSWALVKMKSEDSQWLLLKHRDEFASDTQDALEDDRSVRTGRTTADLRTPRQLELWRPMAPTEAPRAFSHPEWAFELKLDGIRALAYREGDSVRLYSRNGNEITAKFPALVRALRAVPEATVLDGEIVAYGPEGRPSFQTLMQRFQFEGNAAPFEATIPIQYCVFDLPMLRGKDLRGEPLDTRREALETLAAELGWSSASGRIALTDRFPEIGETLFDEARKLGFEGIVGKKRSSRYAQGVRSSEWVKIKGYHSEEFAIGGFTKGAGFRAKTFGALLLGEWSPEGLRHVGNCGGGFTDQQTETIRATLERWVVPESPFVGPVTLKTAEQPTWTEPRLLAEVRYQARTREGKLRFPIFLRLRPDLGSEPGTPPVPETPNEAAMSRSHSRALFDALQSKEDALKIDLEGDTLELSNLSKIYWPETETHPAFTKRDLLTYYAQVGPWILPHLRDRPLSLGRYPGGIDQEGFFQKHWEGKRPNFVETVDIYSSHNRRAGEYMLCQNLATLLWLGQVGVLEIHPWYSRIAPEPGAGQDFASSEASLDASVLDRPDFLVVDLDPYLYSGLEKEGAEPELHREAFAATCAMALETKKLLDTVGLQAFVKTSGKTGLHLYVPLQRIYGYDAVRAMAQTLGQTLLGAFPKQVTLEWSVVKRKGKVFFDHNQNARGKTLAAPYSPRPNAFASVSCPVEWEELESVYPPDFDLRSVPERLQNQGDPWEAILELPQSLT